MPRFYNRNMNNMNNQNVSSRNQMSHHNVPFADAQDSDFQTSVIDVLRNKSIYLWEILCNEGVRIFLWWSYNK